MSARNVTEGDVLGLTMALQTATDALKRLVDTIDATGVLSASRTASTRPSAI